MDFTVHISGFGQMFGVPNAVVDQYLKLATPSQLKVLLYLLRHCNQKADNAEVAKALGVSEELVEEAMLFWSQTDLFSVSEQAAATAAPMQEETAVSEQPAPQSEKSAAKESAHSRNVGLASIQLSGRLGELTPVEISTAIEASDDLKTLFRMSEQQVGRPLRHVEQKALIYMHDYNNIGSDIILTVLSYCIRSLDKNSVNYAESVIVSWWNDGIQTLKQVNDAINEMEYRRSFTGHIQKTFEMNRKPTPKQQEYIDAWQDKQIPVELIGRAYEETIETIEKLSFKYINNILMRWMDAGYRTREDVEAEKKSGNAKGNGSFGNKKAVPKSDNAEAYESFIYNNLAE